MLNDSSSITVLDLSWNKINNDAAFFVVEGVKTSKSLRSLDLSWNEIGKKATV